MNDDLIRRSDAIKALGKYCEEDCYYRGDNWCPQCQREEFQEAIKAVPSADPPKKVVAQITFDEEKLREIVKEAVERFKEEYEITDRPQGEWIDENNNIVPLDKDGCPRGWCKCSKCGDYLSASDEYAVRGFFCPNCGARMKGADDEAN